MAQIQNVLTTQMLNQTKETLKLHDQKQWEGKVIGSVPGSIEISANITAMGSDIVDAVIYKSPTKSCAWLLAWRALGDGSSKNKVYVETGVIDKFLNVNWDDIKNKLDNSTSESHYVDKDTKAEASAMIGDTTNNAVGACAVFDFAL